MGLRDMYSAGDIIEYEGAVATTSCQSRARRACG